jgi:hypothetical protein
MPLIVSDIVTDLDLLGLEERLDDDFGAGWAEQVAEKRKTAVDWIERRLRAEKYNTDKHLIRFRAAAIYSVTGGTYTDRTEALGDHTPDDVDLNDIYVDPSADAVFVGLAAPFRGLYVTMLDAVNANTLTASSLTYWNGGKWMGLSSLVDGTTIATSIALSGGGRFGYKLPEDWMPRQLHATHANTALYWLRLMVNRRPSDGTSVGQMAAIRRSVLTTPAAFYALGLLYRESAMATQGGWLEKSEKLFEDAKAELTVSLALVDREFDIDASQVVEPVEINSVRAEMQNVWTLERG